MMRSRSDAPDNIDIYTLQSFHAQNIVDLLLTVFDKLTRLQKLITKLEPRK